ncbi:DNA mismatch repair protein [Pedobacter sp. MC2016-05]|uniref:MutS-related protein n=1 Tax=Pedobacter sp. MC2016-05 TaxID=2994474 RepID=UPI002246DFF0|nr:DNA mismatch repair protein [Pedobacter sp. MC2016-05]MCX2475353.1 DNA mismatch repair protein [Pedobacter sp. MC2016-05]
MPLNTDQQTINDLNLFGTQGSNSIYEIFNSTRTHGGATILEEMFLNPIGDYEKINQRSQSIQYFAGRAENFPISTEQLSAIETYINNTDSRSKLSAYDQSVAKRIGDFVAPDVQTTAIHNGISAIGTLIREFKLFIDTLVLEDSHPYLSEKKTIAGILASEHFIDMISIPKSHKLTKQQLISYDETLRFARRDAVLTLLESLYTLDVYYSIAKVAKERGFVFPTAFPGEKVMIKIDEVYHPHLQNAVPNSISMSGEKNVVFLTGANMAGKSTFMKAVSIAIFLAHMGFPVPAAKMEFTALDGIYTTINLPDNLGMGASHFYVEVLRAKKIASELKMGKRLFVLFDEMFRGTNVKDACEATIAFTAAFASKPDSLFVISTHIIEAGEVLKEQSDKINFTYLPTTMEGTKPSYTYKLQSGLTADRHGMIIIRNEGILDILNAGLVKSNNKLI